MKKLSYILLFFIFVSFMGCKDDATTTQPEETINESKLLVEYLEANGDFINTAAPSMIAAADVKGLMTTPKEVYLIDIRSAADFSAGHIEGAKNVPFKEVINAIKAVKDSSYKKIVLVCYSGQTAAYANSLARLMGYSNVFTLKWGMSSWNSVFAANYWSAKMGNNHSTEFVTTDFPKAAAGELPVLATGKKTAQEILEARVNALLEAGYTPATISNDAVFSNLSSNYIVNYWPAAQYTAMGHIPNSIQYEPKSDLKSSKNLKTLPTNKPVVFYCYTGQTSSFVAAYLRVLGYDARTLLYGCNAMIYDKMVGQTGYTTFSSNEIKGYDYVTGN